MDKLLTAIDRINNRQKRMSLVQEYINICEPRIAENYIRASAITALANFPQYNDYFETGWSLMQVTKDIKTKLGHKTPRNLAR